MVTERQDLGELGAIEVTMARIVVIDDEASIRQLAARVLEIAGHEVVTASDGAEGLEIISSDAQDLVITDLVMPNVSGLEVIRQVRARWPELPIIAISGGERLGVGNLLDPATELGAHRALAKPFSRQELLAAVNDLL